MWWSKLTSISPKDLLSSQPYYKGIIEINFGPSRSIEDPYSRFFARKVGSERNPGIMYIMFLMFIMVFVYTPIKAPWGKIPTSPSLQGRSIFVSFQICHWIGWGNMLCCLKRVRERIKPRWEI